MKPCFSGTCILRPVKKKESVVRAEDEKPEELVIVAGSCSLWDKTSMILLYFLMAWITWCCHSNPRDLRAALVEK